MAALLERGLELERIEAALGRAIDREGSLVVLEGEPGIGKTALLGETAALALARGFRVLSARASELEREYAYGVVRQMLPPDLAPTPGADALAGAAELAAPALGLSERDGRGAPDRGAVLHGLYWLMINLTARGPVLVSLDDAQWSDLASLRFIAYLARRLEGLPVLVALSVRTAEPSEPPRPLIEIRGEPQADLLAPAPLGEQGLVRLIARTLGEPVDLGFARRLASVTGGVPFLANELLKALADEGVGPSSESSALIDRTGPETITRSAVARLARLGDVAVSAAQGVAVLGARASLERVGTLLELPQALLPAALDALAAARILRAGDGRLEYVHPVIRTSVYEDIPPFVRAQLHARAAAMIEAAGGEPEEVASHMLRADPREDQAETEILVRAAAQAGTRGAPESAVAYLRHAVATSPPKSRGAVLLALGQAEQAAGDPECVPHLRAAIQAAEVPGERAMAALALAGSLFYVADFSGSVSVLDDALAALGDRDDALSSAMRAMSASAGYGDTRLHAGVRAQLPRLRRVAGELGSRARELQIFLALVTATDGGSTDGTRELVERGLDGGRLLEEAGSDAGAVALAVNVLVFVDELDRAERLADEMLADARRRGLVMGFIAGSAHRGLVALRRGDLTAAEAETRAALELAQQHGLAFAIPFSLTYLSEALLERGEIETAIAMIDALPAMPGAELTLAGAMLTRARGLLALAAGDRRAGAERLRAAGDVLEALTMVNPNAAPWRADLALALAHDGPEEALELTTEDLRLARASGSPRATGIALRVSGLLQSGEDSIATLAESAQTLERSGARLEHARSLVELGAAMRRANRRSDARGPLRAGLDLATRCGAGPLADQARQELLACGARPRRALLTGRDALTPSELRIAELAGRGDSNRDIAQSLFITPKTVENHLGRIYKKLSIRSREELPHVLASHRTDS
jgi:DNA-binding CsgD family transcriptional regulator